MRAAAALALALVLLAAPVRARAWELFRSESSDVEQGNQHLEKGQSKEALEAYDRAARALPDDPGVQLDRGLALLAQEKRGEAREAFRRAAAGTAPKELRGKALYNMGLAFLEEGEQASKAEDLDGAKKMLEEAVDAFKGSLRAVPGNKDAAWNFELAKRRLLDVQKKQEEKKNEQENKDKNKDKQQDKQENKDDQNQQNDRDDAGTPQKPERGPDAGEEQPDGGSQADPDQPQGDDAGTPPQPDGGGPDPEPQPREGEDPNALPEHMERALDALEASEENLEKQRARQRARTRPRRVEKDW